MPGKGWIKKEKPKDIKSNVKDILKSKESVESIQRKVGRPKKVNQVNAFLTNLMNKTSEEKQEILVSNLIDSINYAILGLPIGEIAPLESKAWVDLVKVLIDTGMIKFTSNLGIEKNKKEETMPINNELLSLLGVN